MKREMTPREETRIRRAAQDKIMYFAPTISPAPKNTERNEIESLENAIRIYAEGGANSIIIQPKYMGSYCDIYLHKNIEESRFFSRNGFLINRIPKEDLIKAATNLHQKFSWDNVKLRLIQSELLPWSALGKGLIVRDFGGYLKCHSDYCDYLRTSRINEAFKNASKDPKFLEYLKDSNLLTKSELAKKYQQHEVRQYEGMRKLQIPNVKSYSKRIDLYREQLNIYGSEGELSFKPFNLLKTIFDDETEVVATSNISGFRKVSDDEFMVINFKDGAVEDEDIVKAYEFYNGLIENNMEGVVVKPDQIFGGYHAPMFKVRNFKYLHLIYGVSFGSNYPYYFEKRRVSKKMRCSKNQWKISQAILNIPYHQVDKSNEDYLELLRKRILEEDFESTLDGRL